MNLCSVTDCQKPIFTKKSGLCQMHYTRMVRYGSTNLPVKVPKSKEKCSINNCDNDAVCRTWCTKHYHRMVRYGDPNENRKPGRSITRSGYVRIWMPEHPYAQSGHYVNEHRFVMEKALGRYLRKNETIHHKNGIRHDNRIENLELWTSRHPKGGRVSDLLKWAQEIINLYEDEVIKL